MNLPIRRMILSTSFAVLVSASLVSLAASLAVAGGGGDPWGTHCKSKRLAMGFSFNGTPRGLDAGDLVWILDLRGVEPVWSVYRVVSSAHSDRDSIAEFQLVFDGGAEKYLDATGGDYGPVSLRFELPALGRDVDAAEMTMRKPRWLAGNPGAPIEASADCREIGSYYRHSPVFFHEVGGVFDPKLRR